LFVEARASVIIAPGYATAVSVCLSVHYIFMSFNAKKLTHATYAELIKCIQQIKNTLPISKK